MTLFDNNQRLWNLKGTKRTSIIRNGEHGDYLFSDDRGDNFVPCADGEYDAVPETPAPDGEFKTEVIGKPRRTMTDDAIKKAAEMSDPYEGES